LPLSLFSHSAIVAILVALPILAPAVMPSVFADDDPTWIAVGPPPSPPPPPRLTNDPPVSTTNADAAPLFAPDTIAPEPPERAWREPDNVAVITGGFSTGSDVLVPPPPVVVAAPTPVRVGGAIRPPQRLREVNPVYSTIAQVARVQGIVIIEATIGEDGQVTNARILRSVPLLDQAAIDAVRQWQYSPTLLNGVPVPVIMTVTVNFTLR
jgi:protein TonB